jgi:hypothetical protein
VWLQHSLNHVQALISLETSAKANKLARIKQVAIPSSAANVMRVRRQRSKPGSPNCRAFANSAFDSSHNKEEGKFKLLQK